MDWEALVTGEHVTAYFIALVAIYYLVRVAIWIGWPRKTRREIEP